PRPRLPLAPPALRPLHQRRPPGAALCHGAQVRRAFVPEPRGRGARPGAQASRAPAARPRARHRRARGPHPPPRTGAVHSKRGPAPTTGGTDTPGLPPRDTLTVPRRYEVVGIEGLPEIHRGNDLAGLLAQAARAQGTPLEAGDLLVVSQKIVSKTEGRIVNLGGVVPSREAA